METESTAVISTKGRSAPARKVALARIGLRPCSPILPPSEPQAGRFATLDNARARSLTGLVMNDPEVTMPDPQPRTQLIVLSTALEAAGIALSLASRAPAPLRSIGDQLIRAASSVPANLNEGHGRTGRDRLQHWRIAYASAKEVDAHLRLLEAASSIDRDQARLALGLFDQVRAMTWRLLHPRR